MKKIQDDQRINFLPKFFGWKSIIVENALYQYADKYLDEYTGGYWEFYEVGNAPLMVWDTQKEVTITTDFCSARTNAATASVALFMLAVNHLLCAIYEKDPAFAEKLDEVYYALRDWVWSDETQEEVEALGIDRSIVYRILD